MAGTAGQQIGAAGTQPPISTYVQDTLAPVGDTNCIGCNPKTGYVTNAFGGAVGFISPCDRGTTQTDKDAVWASSAVVLIPTDKVTLVAGVATTDNATGTHTVFANVPAGGYFWAVEI